MGTVNALLVYIFKHFFSNIKLFNAALYFLLTLPKPACKTYKLFSRSFQPAAIFVPLIVLLVYNDKRIS